MKTFTLGPTEGQSYYAIRIFAVVHLFAGAGLVLLLDGARGGLGGAGLISTLLLLLLAIRPVHQIVAARRGTLDGHIVVTSNAVAICRANQGRRFFHRRDFIGYLPRQRRLITRDRSLLSVDLPGSRTLQLDAFDGVIALWWPEQHPAPWRQRVGSPSDPMLEERVIPNRLARKPSLQSFVVVPHRARLFAFWMGMLVALGMLIGIPFLLWRDGGNSPDGLTMVIAFVSYSVTVALLCFVAVSIRSTWFTVRAMVLGKRSLGVIWRDGTRTFYRSSDLVRYNTSLGLLIFREKQPLLLAPWLLAGSYRAFATELLRRWRPGLGVAEMEAVHWRRRNGGDTFWFMAFLFTSALDALFLIPVLMLLWIAWGLLHRESPEESIDLSEAINHPTAPGIPSRHPTP